MEAELFFFSYGQTQTGLPVLAVVKIVFFQRVSDLYGVRLFSVILGLLILVAARVPFTTGHVQQGKFSYHFAFHNYYRIHNSLQLVSL